MKTAVCMLALWVLAGGCLSNYTWTSGVPEKMRTVSVPTFRNESKVTELGSLAARQLLREFQREGTFSVRRAGDAALEIQGVIDSATSSVDAYDRRGGLRRSSRRLKAVATVSVVDKLSGKVVINNRKYHASATFATGDDQHTDMRDASGRLADDLSRQIVDDVLSIKW